MIQIGAGLTIILGLGFVRASCSVIEKPCTFFILMIGAIVYQAMEKRKNDTLKTVIRSMKRQNICENFLVLQSVTPQLNLKLNFEEVEFNDDELNNFPIPLQNIFSIRVYENTLYILCDNLVMHIVDLENKFHQTKILEKQPGFCLLALWIFRLKAYHYINSLAKKYHQCLKSMKKKMSSTRDLLTYLKSLPESTETIDKETGNLIAGILNGMKAENPLQLLEEESIIELELHNGIFICLLDENRRLIRLFRENKEDNIITRLK